jgi:four helix bundle protein
MQNYKDLIVWQKSHLLVLDIYRITRKFPKEEQYILTSQLKRASLSVALNIVEGSGKYTDADTANFFQTSLGSLQETEYCLLLSKELAYINTEKYTQLEQSTGAIKGMLISLIKRIRDRVNESLHPSLYTLHF